MDFIVCCIMSSVNWADWVSIIVDIIKGCVIAWILAAVVPKKMNDDRALKDFYINELKTIKDEYNDLCKVIALGKSNSIMIKETFKQLSMKLSDIERSINKQLRTDVNVNAFLTRTQTLVTGTEEINNQYDSDNIVFSPSTRNRIFECQDIFNKNMISAISSANSANRR